MQALSLQSWVRTSRLRFPRRGDHSAGRLGVARVLAVVGVAAYNWWVVVPFAHGLMPSVNGFFSDLEVTGRPHAALMSEADLISALLIIAALLLRGPVADRRARGEWKWMVAFAGAAALGGRYSYACSEGLSATCRRLEWQLALPVHHYIHMLAGIAEFAAVTAAAVIAMRRTRHDGTAVARVYSALVKVLAVGYPLLALAYLTDRMGTFVEPVFFLAFSIMALAEIFEPIDRGTAPSWAERVASRGIRGEAVEPMELRDSDERSKARLEPGGDR